VTNWAEYNESLRRRGNFTVWISEEPLALWSGPRRTKPGGQPVYSDLPIETCMTLGMVFRQPLPQTQGLMCSISKLLGVEIAVSSFPILSRRGNGPAGIQLAVDSTGLKIHDASEWREEKHKTERKWRSWRKLHLGLDLVSSEIACSDLTIDGVGDSTALPGLLDQIDAPADLFLADGAYDRDPTCDLLLERFGEGIEIVIPPRKNAMLSPDAAQNPTICDRQIFKIKRYGRIAWQNTSGYKQRSRSETLMGRWKVVIGTKLKARSFENQRTEARIVVRLLNRMTEFGRPSLERTAGIPSRVRRVPNWRRSVQHDLCNSNST
jgi:hypothetical protein